MSQNINLYHAGLEPPRKYFTAQQGLAAIGVTVLGVAVTAGVLQSSVEEARAANLVMAQSVAVQTQAVSTANAKAQLTAAELKELAQLRHQDAGENRMRAVIESGQAGAGGGFSEELLALGRRAHTHVWLTGITLDRQTDTIELRGRTTDAGILPTYLRTLQNESTFRGRQFSQMQINADGADESGAPVPWANFTLRTNISTTANTNTGSVDSALKSLSLALPMPGGAR